MNIYSCATIHTSRNKCIKFVVTYKSFLNNIELHNTNHAFKFALQKSTKLSSPTKCYNK